MADTSRARAQKARQSLISKLAAEPGFVGAGLSTGASGRDEIVVLVTDASSPLLAKVPKTWQGIPVRTEVGGIPRKF